ncbi:protein FAR1-RELATED SEQUENCE 7-like isoform X1 [Benincasa hispida]|uniref:protein FAR1-RELATED SEQUENCE 7-like isoform X1 n=2 Tax=Benincasa hispida TaxID=102211 RepID=UPI0018FF7F5B|nr:protein FAR1-RELATED SEQUENCE 7-like isoform X1 [Benincasa hispida]
MMDKLLGANLTNVTSSDTDLNNEQCENAMIVKAYPIDMVRATDAVDGENVGDCMLEPFVGQEFDSADTALNFYTSYAQRVGFKVRIGQLYRSRTDGTVSSRRFVCSKEGFQLSSRTGCPAVIRVQRRDSGKWVINLFHKDHNHHLDHEGGETPPPAIQVKAPRSAKLTVNVSHRRKVHLFKDVEDAFSCPSGIINSKHLNEIGNVILRKGEPCVGLEFNSANEAYQFYNAYAANAGFRIRIGQLFRSKNDGSITSRRFVCSKEGFQHPSRLGCGAFMRIKRHESGRWVVDRHKKDHNHDLEPQPEAQKRNLLASKRFAGELNGGFEGKEPVNLNNGLIIKRTRENKIGSDWYPGLFEYFQSKQAEDTGFFYAVEVENSNCMNVFWADGRSRFSCSQFGDTIVLDTSYRKSAHAVPFATFIGVNHHKQPVLLACALIADESVESFSWLFQTWLRAMSGCHPLSIIADQDKAIQQAVAQVFPRTLHRFSSWQIREKEQDNLGMLDETFRFEYEKCIYQSQTAEEFDVGWNTLIGKYGLKENAWLKEMYIKRNNWVPLFLRGTFFAGIPTTDNFESFFGTAFNAQTPVAEFISRYEIGLERRRGEERKESLNSLNLQGFLQTKEPVEEQCLRLYTHAVFKVFQKELLHCYRYLGFKIYEEVALSRYLVRRCENDNEKCIVTVISTNLTVNCSCKMFEYEGILCRHILRVFQILGMSEIPPRYILHRWTRNAEYGTLQDMDSDGGPQELKAVMLWSLREAACKYIEAGATSLEKFKLAYEIMREGGRKLRWQR